MKYFAPQYASALHDLAEETPAGKRREMLRDFLATMGRNGSLSILPEVIREFEALSDKKAGLHHVTISAPDRLPEAEVAKKLHLKAKVTALCDARLKGGVTIEVDDLRVDNSIAVRMGRIRKALC